MESYQLNKIRFYMVILILGNFLYTDEMIKFFPTKHKLIFTDSSQNSIIILKGQQIRINDGQRKLYYHNSNPIDKTITTKDIKYRVIYTKHEKKEYHFNEIESIQIRLDNMLIKNMLLSIPMLYAQVPSIIPFIVPITLIAGAMAGGKDIELGSGVAIPIMIHIIRNSWLIAKKAGKGDWITIPLKGENAWEIKSVPKN